MMDEYSSMLSDYAINKRLVFKAGLQDALPPETLMATARDDGGFWVAMFDTVTTSDMLQILTPDVMLDLLSDKCGSAYEMYENYLYIYSPKDEFRGTGQET